MTSPESVHLTVSELEWRMEDGPPTARLVGYEWALALARSGCGVRLTDRVPRDLRDQDPAYADVLPLLMAEPTDFDRSIVQATPLQLATRPLRKGRVGLTFWTADAGLPGIAAPLSAYDELWLPDESAAAAAQRAHLRRVRILPLALGDEWFEVGSPFRFDFYFVGMRDSTRHAQAVVDAFGKLPGDPRLIVKLPFVPALAAGLAERTPKSVLDRVALVAEDWSRARMRALHRGGSCLVTTHAPGWDDLLLLEAKAAGNVCVSLSTGHDGWAHPQDQALSPTTFPVAFPGDYGRQVAELHAAMQHAMMASKSKELSSRLQERHARSAVARRFKELVP